jgi:hypothetical protein
VRALKAVPRQEQHRRRRREEAPLERTELAEEIAAEAAEPSHTPTVALATLIAISSGVPMRSSGRPREDERQRERRPPELAARHPTFIGGAWAMCPAA